MDLTRQKHQASLQLSSPLTKTERSCCAPASKQKTNHTVTARILGSSSRIYWSLWKASLNKQHLRVLLCEAWEQHLQYKLTRETLQYLVSAEWDDSLPLTALKWSTLQLFAFVGKLGRFIIFIYILCIEKLYLIMHIFFAFHIVIQVHNPLKCLSEVISPTAPSHPDRFCKVLKLLSHFLCIVVYFFQLIFEKKCFQYLFTSKKKGLEFVCMVNWFLSDFF